MTERMGSVRSVSLGIWIGTGSAMESTAESGISHLLEHMLFRGTSRYESQEIDQIFDGMGAEINAGTGKDTTTLYSRVIDHHLDRAFDVMGDMIWRPRLKDVDAERQVVLEEISMYEDDPQDKVFDLLGAAVYGDHPLGRPVIGTAEVVSGATAEFLRSYHDERYVPSQIVVAAAGSVDHSELVDMVRAAAAQTQRPGDGQPAGAPPAQPRDGANGRPEWQARAEAAPDFERRVRFIQKETEQYHLCLGGPGINREDERRFALRVLDNVIGASASSRLFQEVRERRGLAYSVFSFQNLYARTGDVGLYLGTRPENLGMAVSVIASELTRLVAEPVSEAELQRSRENLKGRMVLALESTGAHMNRLGSSVLHGLPIMSLEEAIERIDAVTLDELWELARELFAPGRLALAAIGPDEETFNEAIGGISELAEAGLPG